MSGTPSEPSTSDPVEESNSDLPELVEWAVAAVMVLIGLAVLAGGWALTSLVDREAIANAVREGTIEGDFMTEAELIEVATSLANWTGIGLLVTGGLLVIAGAVFAYLRRRTRRRRRAGTETGSDFVANAVVGAVSSVVFAFVPFATVLGGAIAGYLEHRESDRTLAVGALAGGLGAAPVALVLGFVTTGLVAGAMAAGDGGLATFLGILSLFVVGMAVAFSAGFGALGGFIGDKIAEDRDGA